MNGRSAKQLGLVADIGGTNGRFALVCDNGTELQLRQQRSYICASFKSFAEMVTRYLHDSGEKPGQPGVIAIAGPVVENSCHMTNGPFVVDGGQLCEEGVFSDCLILNDFAALASSLPVLKSEHLMQIGLQSSVLSGSKLVVGPGTGLGAAFLAQAQPANGAPSLVLEGEGGHMGFAPFDDLEIELLGWFAKKYGRVSMERILSGPGLEDLHEARAFIEGRAAEKCTAEQIMTKGLLSEENERNTLQHFCALLGSFTGDLALAGGCWGGVYIAGGIAPRMRDLLATSAFRARFEAKGRFAEKLRNVPSWLITDETPALRGAAMYLKSL